MPNAEETRRLNTERIKAGQMTAVGRLILFSFPRPTDMDSSWYEVETNKICMSVPVSRLKKLTVQDRLQEIRFSTRDKTSRREWTACELPPS